jgi:hypothetical protein
MFTKTLPDGPKVAVAEVLFGTVAGVQFVAVLQFWLVLPVQVCAELKGWVSHATSSAAADLARIELRGLVWPG